MNNLGILYEQGQGVSKDIEKALEWYQKSAAAGEPIAMENIADIYNDGRSGIIGQAQLDDAKTCDANMIGTGPFKLKEWKRGDHLSVFKNPDYWQKDAN